MVASTTERASFMGSDGFLAGNFFFGACFMVAFRLGCNMTHNAIASSLSPTLGDSNFTSAHPCARCWHESLRRRAIRSSTEWLQSYNEERPRDALEGLPPAIYRAHLEATSSQGKLSP